MLHLSTFKKTPQSGAARAGQRQRGVTLLQLTLMLTAVMALVVGLTYKTTDFFSKNQVLDSDALLRLADNQLRQYVVANGRLPCPDLNADGTEDYDAVSNACKSGSGAAQQKGYLPYITLGMADKNYVYGEVPILYGVYNDGDDVDGSGVSTGNVNLVSKTQVFFPTFANKTNTATKITNPRNIFDFCASLATLEARGATVASAGLAVGATAPSRYTAVFALALPGQANRDGLAAGWTGGPSVNAQYDGLNATSATEFELPQKQVSPTYDDRTAFRAAADLRDYLRCEAMNNSISLLSEAVTIQQEVEDFADANDESATMGIVVNALGIALATWEVIQDIAAIAEAAEQIGIASALLATNTALCPLPPWVTCALIPINVTALVSASIGLGLSIGAAVSAGVGLGLEIAATIYYADVKKRTTRPAPVYNQSTTPTDSVTDARLTKLKANYQGTRATAIAKYALLPGSAPDSTALDNAQKAAASTLTNDINAVTDSTLRTLLGGVLNGVQVSCVAGSADCKTTENVPVLNAPGVLTKVDPKQGLLTCSLTAPQTSDWCLANGYDNMLKTVVISRNETSFCDGAACAVPAGGVVTTYVKPNVLPVATCPSAVEATCTATGYTQKVTTTYVNPTPVISYINPSANTTCALATEALCFAAGFAQKVTQYAVCSSTNAGTCIGAGYTQKVVTEYSVGSIGTTYVNPTTSESCPSSDGPTCISLGYTSVKNTFSQSATYYCPSGMTDSACLAAGYSATGATSTYTSSTKSGLINPYYPGVIPSVDAYYQASKTTVDASGNAVAPDATKMQDAMNTSNGVVNSYGTLLSGLKNAVAALDPTNSTYQQKYADEAAALSALNTALAWQTKTLNCYNNYLTDPTCPLGSNPYGYDQSAWLSQYNTVHGTIVGPAGLQAVYDAAHTATGTAYTARAPYLADFIATMNGTGLWFSSGLLPDGMKLPAGWEPDHVTGSLCGSIGCGWMTGNAGSASGGNNTTFAVSGSSAVNNYLTAYEAYRNADDYTAKKKAADSAAVSAWSDRNSLKSAACSVIKETWVGGAFTSLTEPNPSLWDTQWNSPTTPGANGRDGNNLYGVTWSPTTPSTVVVTSVSAGGTLKCGGGPTTAQLQAKYCTVGGPDYNVDVCKQYSAPATSVLTTKIIQNPAGIVNILIQKGIAR